MKTNSLNNPINETAKRVWDSIYCAIPNANGVAALLGNLYFKSGMDPKAVKSNGASDISCEKYTDGVDNGLISNKKFAFDGIEYGLCGWKDWTRKLSMYNLAKKMGKSIGDPEFQAFFILDELNGVTYGPVKRYLTRTKDGIAAAHYIAQNYIRHKNISIDKLAWIMNYSELYFNTYGADNSGRAKVIVTRNTYIRDIPERKGKALLYATKGMTFDIMVGINEKDTHWFVCCGNGTGNTGWISKQYCKKM